MYSAPKPRPLLISKSFVRLLAEPELRETIVDALYPAAIDGI